MMHEEEEGMGLGRNWIPFEPRGDRGGAKARKEIKTLE